MENNVALKKVGITPKGLILMSFGGYNSRDKANKVVKALTEFMQKNERALMIIDGNLSFVSVREKKRKRFLGIF